jgi:hypothetical protein
VFRLCAAAASLERRLAVSETNGPVNVEVTLWELKRRRSGLEPLLAT